MSVPMSVPRSAGGRDGGGAALGAFGASEASFIAKSGTGQPPSGAAVDLASYRVFQPARAPLRVGPFTRSTDLILRSPRSGRLEGWPSALNDHIGTTAWAMVRDAALRAAPHHED